MSDWHDLEYEAAMSACEDDLERDADVLVKSYGLRAAEKVPPRRFGEEPEEIEPDYDLERAVRRRVRELGARLRLPRGHCSPRRIDRRLSGGRPRARARRTSSPSRGDPDEPPLAELAERRSVDSPWAIA